MMSGVGAVASKLAFIRRSMFGEIGSLSLSSLPLFCFTPFYSSQNVLQVLQGWLEGVRLPLCYVKVMNCRYALTVVYLRPSMPRKETNRESTASDAGTGFNFARLQKVKYRFVPCKACPISRPLPVHLPWLENPIHHVSLLRTP